MSGPTVAVIGGGIAGLATAAFLAEGGASVTLYEREAIAAGASGRNSGSIQQSFDPPLVSLYHESVEHYRRLGAVAPGAGFVLPPEPAGLLLVTHHAAVAERLAVHLRSTHPDLEPEVLTGADLAALEPSIAPGVHAVRVPIGFPIVPAAPTYAWATRAEALGVTIRLGRAARPMVAGDRVTGVDVDGRHEAAEAVVVAAGPWTSETVDPSGRWRPIRPLWGVVVETLMRNPPRHILEEASMDVALGTGEVAVAAGEARADPAEAPETSLITAGGATAVGSTFLEAEPDPLAWTERILERAATFVPDVADAPIRETRACARPLARDGRPLTGAVPWVAGLYVCSGHGPWGISIGPASARQVADLVLGRSPAIDPAFDPARFGGA
ncbi:MAG TPA: FAD-dependent oxidoreductase [Candidatus Limnocylindrales bacterium]|nr:FAD-dependent oxidoreductase [Candidatus Limnocylindrales bacterium]